MAIINQDGVTRLMTAINGANSAFTTQMKNGATNFATSTAAIWESNNATKFANNLKTDLDNIALMYKKAVQNIYDVLDTNVKNHNKRNDGSVSIKPLEYTTPDTSSLTTTIKNKFANGDEGVKEGSDVTSLQSDYTTAMASIKSALDDAVSAASSSDAFGADEISSFKSAYQNLKNKFEEIQADEASSLKEFLAKEKESDTNLASTNKSNFGA